MADEGAMKYWLQFRDALASRAFRFRLALLAVAAVVGWLGYSIAMHVMVWLWMVLTTLDRSMRRK